MLQSDQRTEPRTPPRQLLVYRFPPDSSFQGQLVGALERMESGGAMRILDALFVGRDRTSGELIAASMTAEGAGGLIGRLLSFRMEANARTNATRRALDGAAGALIQAHAAGMEPGEAAIAILVEHSWAQVLGDAIERLGGTESVNTLVADDRLTEAWAPPD
jgi:hypothetical protein